MRELRLIELFAGYGSQAMALKRLEIPFKHWKVVEFDKYAVNSYNAIHGTNFKPTDIRDIHAQDLEITDTDKNDYLLTYSFPCTDLSLAGKQEGMSRGSGTRSGLLWEVERILKECKELPQYLLMENVPQVHGEQNVKDFGDWISFLDSLGYISKWEDLNAKDYGVAQNRDRCFMVSYLDKSIKYSFPSPVRLTKTAKDYLEDNVDDKYYIKTERAQELIDKLIQEANPKIDEGSDRAEFVVDLSTTNGDMRDITTCIKTAQRGVETRDNKETGVLTATKRRRLVVERSTTSPSIRDLSNCIKAKRRDITKHQATETGVLERIVVEERQDEGLRTFSSALCGALRTIDSGGDKRVIEKRAVANTRGYLNYTRIEETNKDLAKTICARDFKGFGTGFDVQNGVIERCVKVGDLEDGYEIANRVDSVSGLSPSITTSKSFFPNYLVEYRIRKLTPLECLRLMDVTDEDAKKILDVNSDTQAYKQAGNSIVVSVMVAIFKNLFLGGSEKEQRQLDIFDIL